MFYGVSVSGLSILFINYLMNLKFLYHEKKEFKNAKLTQRINFKT